VSGYFSPSDHLRLQSFSGYQQNARTTAAYPKEHGLAYTALGLAGEAGEVANKIKKVIRDKDGVLDAQTTVNVADELGDVLWYVAQLATELNIDLGMVALENARKLESRKARGTIKGDGDKR
jgi:NTP pyrophosphatase (non-canonical NTP hydrolase)